MPAELDDIMEQASVALAKMEYLTCESLCLTALSRARGVGDWGYYARILLPLQEARRQRRMIAAEGAIRLGTTTLTGQPADWLRDARTGCIVVTHPHKADTAHALDAAAREQRLYVEVLFADNAIDAPKWVLRSFRSPRIACEIAAPPKEWLDRWLAPGGGGVPRGARTPADWFIDATEAIGDAALAQLPPTLSPSERLAALEACLDVVTDHEIIHQRLGDAARFMNLNTAPVAKP